MRTQKKEGKNKKTVAGSEKAKNERRREGVEEEGSIDSVGKRRKGRNGTERNEIPDQPAYRGINPVQPGHY